ncbi:MAG: hypothetical protein Q9176_003185 [Flavoplaca citrina]
MACYEGATIHIVSDGKRCPMYDDPDADGHEDPYSIISPPQKYIEAINGAKFAVGVTLEPDFDFAECDAVRAKFFCDTSSSFLQADLRRIDIERGTVGRRTRSINSIISFCPSTGQWQQADLTFGELKIREASESRITLNDIKDLGRIQVVWQRIKWGQKTIQLDYYQVRQRPAETYVEGVPLRGLLGREVRLNILYRSKRTLQMLGCIPRTPSPTLQNSRVEEARVKTDDPQAELRALRARVAELENRRSNTPQPRVKSEQHRSASKVKREREDKANDVKAKKIRTSRHAEVVDLTAD